MISPESAELASFSADFCPKNKDSFYGRLSPELDVKQQVFLRRLLSLNWRFFSKFLYQKNGILALRIYGPIISLFPSSYHFIRSRYSSDLDSFICPTDFRSWSGGSFDLHSPTVLAVSLSACWFKHRKIGELTSHYLSRKPTTSQYLDLNCVLMLNWIFWSRTIWFNHQQCELIARYRHRNKFKL